MVHLLKLCVGVDSVQALQSWIDWRLKQSSALGHTPEQFHTTRMIPKRKDELLQDGSLYWVIKGCVQVRQRLLDIRPFQDDEGIKRCDLILEPKLILTHHQPRRPFQGWRYLKVEDAPDDLTITQVGTQVGTQAGESSEIYQALSKLGLL